MDSTIFTLKGKDILTIKEKFPDIFEEMKKTGIKRFKHN